MGGEPAVSIAAVPVYDPKQTDSEESLAISRARAGDERAIAWLVARYRERAVRLATHVLRSSAEAEDVAQEAFVRAFRSLHRYRGDGRFFTWLYQVVVRICLDRRRLVRWDSEIPLDSAAEIAIPDGRTDTRLLVESLLDSMSPPMRAMLVLRELEGLEYEEIAQVLQIPVGRVRWRLHEARARFQRLWTAAIEETEHV